MQVWLKKVEENFNSREVYIRYIHSVENIVKYIQRKELHMLTSITEKFVLQMK